ncbi:MAG: tyrosine--tRNA ligase [Candidatus Taylorbacteria bacterium]|nr:tyrosine--tRNA ligase [Candidatus Taylorbacteria bacterium]
MFNFNKKVEVVRDEKIIELTLSRGIEAIFPNKDFLKSKMIKGERLSFYLGIDPTGPTLHIGHAITIKKLAEFQKLGHQIFFLIGDFTATIGDPTDKGAVRKKLTMKEIMENCKEYQKQASHFIDFSGPNKALLKFNSEWLLKMNFGEVIELSSLVTVDQMLKRDMFVKRMEENKPIYLHEFMYPLMQGYDSVAMDVDGEIGGNDQTFNMLMGRDLMKKIKNKEKFVIATKLLTDSDGKKMGKTEGNMVSLDQTPEDMFGKVMSWSDNLIIPGFEIITDISMEEIDSIKNKINSGLNPKEFKVRLAKEVATMIHGKEAAEKAEKDFDKTFTKGEVPEDISQVLVALNTPIKDEIIKSGIVSSGADWKRLIDSKAVTIAGTDEVITDPFIKAEKEMTLRIGKKRFVKIVIK